MKISSLYLNSLLAGLIVLLTFVLALLFLIQPGDKLPERYTYGADDTPATYGEIEEIETKIAALESLVAKEKILAAEQMRIQTAREQKLKTQLSGLATQLDASTMLVQQTQDLLNQEKDLAEQLNLQLEIEKARALTQETSLTSSSAEVLMLVKNLKLEKGYIQSLQAGYEAEKLKLLNTADELEQKKRELVRNKRELAISKEALASKKRELTISKGRVDDMARKNQSLNRKLSILNSDPSIIRQTSQDQAFTASPNS
jgi:DNA repair exonuclease SbcCD ATPase subunit